MQILKLLKENLYMYNVKYEAYETIFFTPSVPNYKSFQKSWRVKVFQV